MTVVFRAEDQDAWVERHDLPNGSTVFYKDGEDLHASQKHSYWEEYKGLLSCAGRVPGISTISQHDGDGSNDNLLNWVARLAYEGIAHHAIELLDNPDTRRSTMAWMRDPEQIQRTLYDHGQSWQQVREAKGKTGSVSHAVLETLAAGDTPALTNGYDHAVADWWHKRNPEPLDVEQVVYSQAHGFAGRFDLRANFFHDGEGVIRKLVDLKTSGFISNSFHIQLAGYELAATECGIGQTDRQMILQVKDDGSWIEWEGYAQPDDFLIALATYRLGQRIGAKARKAWREWKSAQGLAEVA